MVYLKILLFLYADDTILLSESSKDVQLMLDTFANYVKIGNGKLILKKAKILIFSRCRISEKEKL